MERSDASSRIARSRRCCSTLMTSASEEEEEEEEEEEGWAAAGSGWCGGTRVRAKATAASATAARCSKHFTCAGWVSSGNGKVRTAVLACKEDAVKK